MTLRLEWLQVEVDEYGFAPSLAGMVPSVSKTCTFYPFEVRTI